MPFDRRSYLKGAVSAGAIVTGLGGATAGLGQSNGRGGRPDELSCPAGTTELARYAVDDGSFELESGEDVVDFEVTSDSGPVSSFSWDSESVVAVLAVQYDSTVELFEGGFDGEVSVDESVSTVSVCAPRGGRAVLCELDMDHPPDAYDTEFHLDGDPASGDRDGVVHVVSTEATTDYAHSMVNVLARADERIALSELEAVTYDYYLGGDNDGDSADEVFVTLLTPDDQLKLAVTTVSESVDTETWQELDVYDLMGMGRWHVEDISFEDLSTTDLSITTAQNLRSDPDEGNVDLRSAYSDATLAGVGFGAGNTRNETSIDRYFDDLTIEWDPEDGDAQTASYDFPALLPFTVESAERRGRGRGPLVVTHAFQQEEMGVSLDDAVPESVKLNEFGAFAPPPEPGIEPTAIDVDDETLELRFRPPDVDDFDGPGFIASGDFDLPTGTSFFAEGELE